LLLIPIGFLPWITGISGLISLVVIFIANMFMIYQCVQLYRKMEVKAARKVMFGSYIYLPVVFFAMLADKI
jgi:protoheme IX farnesyltransferase